MAMMSAKSPVDLNGTSPQGTSASSGPVSPGPLLNLQIVWGAMLASIGFHVGFGFFASTQMGPAPAADTAQLGVMELAFAVTSLGCLAVSYLLPKKMLQQAMDKEDPATIELSQLATKSFTPWILRMALSETVAIFGLLLVMMSHQMSKMIPFVVLGGLSMLTAIPSERAIRIAAGASS